MAGNYGPEIKAAMGDSKPGRVNTSPSKSSAKAVQKSVPKAKAASPAAGATKSPVGAGAPQPIAGVQHATMPQQANMPPDGHHVAAATSIAHAILGRGGM